MAICRDDDFLRAVRAAIQQAQIAVAAQAFPAKTGH